MSLSIQSEIMPGEILGRCQKIIGESKAESLEPKRMGVQIKSARLVPPRRVGVDKNLPREC